VVKESAAFLFLLTQCMKAGNPTLVSSIQRSLNRCLVDFALWSVFQAGTRTVGIFASL